MNEIKQNSSLWWRTTLAPYRQKSLSRSLGQLTLTYTLYVIALVFSVFLWRTYGFSSALVPLILSTLFAMRLFILQHDCGHMSLFSGKRQNKYVGRMLSIVTWFPFHWWAAAHNRHHKTVGNLDCGVDDFPLWTVNEYRTRSVFDRTLYSMIRNPIVFLSVGPILNIIKRIVPIDWNIRASERISHILSSLFIIMIYSALGSFIAIEVIYSVLFVQYFGNMLGIWVFFVQHQFKGVRWQRDEAWNYYSMALGNSSFFDLGKKVNWLAANIGYHHVHHLDSKIPNYNLKRAYDEVRELRDSANRITLWKSFSQCPAVKLWDEENGYAVHFRDITESIY